jgi:hypothetical protein
MARDDHREAILFRIPDKEGLDRRQADYAAFRDAAWAAAGEGKPREDRWLVFESIAAHAMSLGLDRWGNDHSAARPIVIPSERFPGHDFRVGRLCYGDRTDRALRNLGLRGIGWMLCNEGGADGTLAPDWVECLGRVGTCLDRAARSLPEGDWLLGALGVVQETVDHVLSQSDPRAHYLRWT